MPFRPSPLLAAALALLPLFGQPAPAVAAEPYCREYTKLIDVGGKPAEGYGTACLKEDGSWEIVSEPEVAKASPAVILPPAYAVAEPRAIIRVGIGSYRPGHYYRPAYRPSYRPIYCAYDIRPGRHRPVYRPYHPHDF